MLLKWIGMALIFVAVIGRIFTKELEFAAHRQQLQQFALLLTVLKNEICLLRLPLPLALAHCAGQVQEPFAALCRCTSELLCAQNQTEVPQLWRTLVGQQRAWLFDAAERALLEEAGELLRMDNVAFKEERFTVFDERLARLTESYENGLSERRRINRYGTALAGAFIILLLL